MSDDESRREKDSPGSTRRGRFQLELKGPNQLQHWSGGVKRWRKSTFRTFEMNKVVQLSVLVPESCMNVHIHYKEPSVCPNMHH